MNQPIKTTAVRPVSIARGRAASIARVALIACAALAALGTVYLVGLAPLPVFHDSFHDVRHSSGFPCH